MSTPNIYPPPLWQAEWDEAVGLWWSDGPGHTPPVSGLARVHSAPRAAARLLLAAQAGVLGAVDAPRVLATLRGLQLTDGPLRGVGKWFWEEDILYDSNAAFFVGLNLLVLWQGYREQLSPECCEQLLAIFADLRCWFARSIRERAFYYPNKTLGDLVCGWLLDEILVADGDNYELRQSMREAADYWLKHAWGWGEHLSDIYAQVCLDELSVLLLLSERLPDELRATYTRLFTELLAIDDAYADGPRVPTFRSYAFTETPVRLNYRARICPLDTVTPLNELVDSIPVGPTLHQRGWHEFAPIKPAPVRPRTVEVPCFNNVAAHAWITDDVRLGSASRVPLMPSAEHLLWGMSWMCFPAVFWRPAGDWGFLQWATREDGYGHSHPEELVRSYVGQSLTQRVLPPIVGRTWCIQHGDSLVALRIMPAVPTSWEQLTDRFRLVSGHAEVTDLPGAEPLAGLEMITPGRANIAHYALGAWSQLVLTYPERRISIHCLPLTSANTPVLTRREDGLLDWELTHAADELTARRGMVTLWAISLDGSITEPPQLTPDIEYLDVPRALEERTWRVRWQWPNREWNLRIDPLAAEALVEYPGDCGRPGIH